MNLKWSCFVSFHTVPEGKYADSLLLFNSLSQAKLLIPAWAKTDVDSYIKNEKEADEELHELIDQLVDYDMLVDADLDEKNRYQELRAKSATMQDKAVFYFTPSFNCNLKCIYCIVEPTDHNLLNCSKFIDDEIIDKAAKWVVDYTKKLEVKKIEIIFFGGEPSLGLKQNIMFMELLKTYAPQDFEIICSMITNGYLYDEDSIIKLKEYGFNGFQITLDGPDYIHNKRRMTVDDKGTFDTIVENIKKYLDMNLLVNVRVNVDKDNGPYLCELIDILKENGFDKRSSFELSFVPVDPNNDKNIKGYKKEALKWYPIFYKHARKQGFKNLALWSTFCGAYSKYILGIGPDGDLYQCPTYTGEKSQVVGNLVTNEFNELYYDYINRDIPDKCKACRWTGICNGGCVLVKNILKDKYCLKEAFDHIVPGYLFAKFDDEKIDELDALGEGEANNFSKEFFK